MLAKPKAKEMARYRCVLCWQLIPWWLGCCDQLERELGKVISRRAFIDLDREADAGICDDCWCAVGGEDVRVDYVDD